MFFLHFILHKLLIFYMDFCELENMDEGGGHFLYCICIYCADIWEAHFHFQ